MKDVLLQLEELKEKYLRIASKMRAEGSDEQTIFRGRLTGVMEAIDIVKLHTTQQGIDKGIIKTKEIDVK